jgi:SnoaL-like domain
MNDLHTVVEEYFAMWNADDPDERLDHARRAFTADARYVDPVADVSGPEGAAAMVGGLRATHPGYAVRRASDLDGHHDVVRFGWEILDGDGELYLSGIDVCSLAVDGRIRLLAGFFGAALAAAATAATAATATAATG